MLMSKHCSNLLLFHIGSDNLLLSLNGHGNNINAESFENCDIAYLQCCNAFQISCTDYAEIHLGLCLWAQTPIWIALWIREELDQSWILGWSREEYWRRSRLHSFQIGSIFLTYVWVEKTIFFPPCL